MDIMKQLAETSNRDIIISLPKNKTWLEYLAHFVNLQSDSGIILIFLPEVPKTGPGNKCYIVFDGFLKGWVQISKLRETAENDICIELFPIFHTTQHKAPMSEIEGFKYYLDNFEMQ